MFEPISTAPPKTRWNDRDAALSRADRAEYRRQVKHLERAIAYKREEIERMQAQLDELLAAGPPPLAKRP